MRRYSILFALLFVLSLFQSVFPFINFVLLFSLNFIFLEEGKLALLSAFVGGLLLDLLGTSAFGLYSLASVAAIATCLTVRRVFPKNVLFSLLSIYVSLLIFGFLGSFPKFDYAVRPFWFFVVSLLILAVLRPVSSIVNGEFKKSLS